ncbi:MAG: hypothetical protein A2898_02675 [Candidatus Kerfeldbacteria bacterium RIFCSPLOWO2_01_FULL_48_11]|uniref:Uncharacterized protein n=1 Tax=Candidatus Kerfeldbacteria bacterium RIFCSPLOWO2_01_FULL_48_11 TaxID=1798543 RepID=A0A1G2B1T5_9BACT|nr:MAG: hypothetical protein UY34_C0002G0032 [Parcubacteria group bacterium GW2011_GWA2_48_9]KKW15766.1 MAG: hypothetical protein UY52_C0014G0009 [Parcubacteria group bacterium GW2011_GWC2_49_9]OGY83153.1 MAG: hypothetical protein A2898_02675 [Candidatus Kerfeldbacteria bacterium RIFCSPLOWO2_01_FULL_48_11]HCM68176.1 hypothetical protein [Candidatus Kerfeldbacteria bacterium]
MSEQHPQQTCPHCGYPVEIAEHAPGCPNAVEQIAAIEQADTVVVDIPESVSPTEGPQGDGKILESSGTPGISTETKEARDSAIQKIKRAARRLVLWGMIYGSALTTLDSPSKQPQEQLREKQSLSEYHVAKDKQRDSEQSPFTITPEKYEELRATYNARIETFTKQVENAKHDLDYLKSIYGDDLINVYISMARDAVAKGDITDQDSIESKVDLVTTGFEEFGITSEHLKQICRSTFPKNWVLNEVDSIIYTGSENQPDSAEYLQHTPKSTDWTTMAVARLKDHGVTSIDVSPHTEFDPLFENLAHELGHANDWRSNNNLTADQRMQLFAEVTRRYTEGENVFYSDYVETKNDLNKKVKEFWAEICAAYFINPDQLRAEHPEDFALVDKWVKLEDPGFNAAEKATERNEMYNQYSSEFKKQQWQATYAALPEAVRSELESLPEQIACDAQRDGFFSGDGSYNPHAIVQEVFARHHIQKEPDWRLVSEISNRISEAGNKNGDMWKGQFENELMESMSPEARNELSAYLGQIQKEFAKTSGTENDSFDWDAIDKQMQKDLAAFREKYDVKCTLETLYNWVFYRL